MLHSLWLCHFLPWRLRGITAEGWLQPHKAASVLWENTETARKHFRPTLKSLMNWAIVLLLQIQIAESPQHIAKFYWSLLLGLLHIGGHSYNVKKKHPEQGGVVVGSPWHLQVLIKIALGSLFLMVKHDRSMMVVSIQEVQWQGSTASLNQTPVISSVITCDPADKLLRETVVDLLYEERRPRHWVLGFAWSLKVFDNIWL